MLQSPHALELADSASHRLELESGPYLMKIAGRPEEFEGAIRLRSSVFREDFGARSASDDPLWDFDEDIDGRARHLVVIHREQNAVVGTYRLLLSSGTDGFYSQSEFDLSGFLSRPGLKLELSRACVDPYFRGGVILMLLWKGLSEMIRRTGATVLFGCSSLLTEDPARVRLLLEALRKEDSLDDSHGIRALPDYRMDLESAPPLPADADSEASLITPLLRMYLKAGARLAADPAHDRAFRCVDLLTILEVDRMSDTMARKYGPR